MRSLAVITMAAVLPWSAAAQGADGTPAPVAQGSVLQVEVMRRPGVNWRGAPAWPAPVVAQWQLLEVQEQSQLWRDDQGMHLRVDPRSMLMALQRPGQSGPIEFQGGRRPDGEMQAGQRWQASVRYQGQPANWCADLQTTLTGDYEVLPAEAYKLRIDGQETTVQVHPVLRKGEWQRCYSGRQVQRLLWAPSLGVLLGSELLTYNPTGQLHPDSFSVRVTAIERAPAPAR